MTPDIAIVARDLQVEITKQFRLGSVAAYSRAVSDIIETLRDLDAKPGSPVYSAMKQVELRIMARCTQAAKDVGIIEKVPA